MVRVDVGPQPSDASSCRRDANGRRPVLRSPCFAPPFQERVQRHVGADNDLSVSECREKKLTNIRSAGKDENVKLPPPHVMSLEESLEYIEDDELLEVTPTNLRLRKRVLSEMERKKQTRKEAKIARSLRASVAAEDPRSRGSHQARGVLVTA
jgi:hypothetical protein